LNTSIVRV